jgi:hypothetical protein
MQQDQQASGFTKHCIQGKPHKDHTPLTALPTPLTASNQQLPKQLTHPPLPSSSFTSSSFCQPPAASIQL